MTNNCPLPILVTEKMANNMNYGLNTGLNLRIRDTNKIDLIRYK